MKLYNIFQILKKSRAQIESTYHNIGVLKFYIARLNLEEKILNCRTEGVSNIKYFDYDIIVSLTTYGRRINDVCFTIESLMQQTLKANKIILWLDESFRNSSLPNSLERLIKRGLQVNFTKDIKSYKKLIPTLRAFPNDVIITVDDDAIYDFDFIEKNIKAHMDDPKSIYAGRIHSMTFEKNGVLKPYLKWDLNCSSKPSRHLVTGVGGVLYPPHSLHQYVFDEDVFMSICPTADDVWFTAMAKLNGTDIKKILTRDPRGEDYISNEIVQDMALFNTNVGDGGRNDLQIKAVFSKYDIYDLIK